MAFDQSLFQFIYSFAHQSGLLDAVGIFAAHYLPWVLVVLVCVKLFLEKNWKMRLYDASIVALSVILARGVIGEAIRFFYYRPRPSILLTIQPLIAVPASSAFPSSHATVFFAIAMALFFISRRWGAWFLVSALIMGVARVFVGVHWPIDILGGAVIGILSAYIVKKILPPIERYREHPEA